MAQNQAKPARLGAPVIIALALVILVLVGFIVVLLSMQDGNNGGEVEAVSAASYRARVDSLLAVAHPEDAEAALGRHGCIACHRAANDTVAPSWVGLAARAGAERPPMPADAYIYESIIHPGVFLVEGYNDVMPHDFAARMSQQELGDVLAYLLTPDAN